MRRWLVCLFLLQAGCAGPTSPFGGIHSFSKSSEEQAALKGGPTWKERLNNLIESAPQIKIEPTRQVLHQSHDIRVRIYDPKGIPTKSEFKVFYGGYNVSNQLVSRVNQEMSPDRHSMIITYEDVRIPSQQNQSIEFLYRRSQDDRAFVEALRPPSCSFRDQWDVRSTGRFQTSKELLSTLHEIAEREKWNPSFVAGLIAQESAFNTKAVSYAKAIGLTQITPIADLELKRYYPAWPRSPIIERYPAGVIKSFAKSGKLNPQNDWRLDPTRSIEGSIQLLEVMEDFWKMKSNRTLLQESLKDQEEAERVNVLLASYHSGPERVRRAIVELGPKYLQSNELNGARVYVKKVQSFCFHFAHEEERL